MGVFGEYRMKVRVWMLYKIVSNMVMLTPTPVTTMESSYYDLQEINNERIYPLHDRTGTCS